MPPRQASRLAVIAVSMSLCAPGAFAQGKATDSDFLKDYDKVVVPQSVEDNAAKAAVAAPKAPPAHPTQPITLKGRLEEVSGNGANLPVGLLLKLKAQTAKADPSLQAKPKADPLKGLVASFPTDWAGAWGGSLSVWWTQIDPSFWTWDRENAQVTADVLKRGSSGTTTFNFTQNGNTVLVQPARITFPPRVSQDTQQIPANSALTQMFGAAGSQMLQAMNTKIPVVILGDYQGQGIGANTLNLQVVKNDIKQLKPGLLEQDIITREAERKPTGEIKNSFSETVIRFTKLNSSQLYVQAASIKYKNDGHFLDKVIFYGTVNRGYTTPDPSSMMSMPGMGSFPGMPTSPGGGSSGMPSGMPQGLDGLNNVIRELQKGLGQ